jgi:hypothetical protein
MYNQHLNKKGKLSGYAIKPLMTIEQLKEFTEKIYSGVVTISPDILDVYDTMLTEYAKEIKSRKKKFISSRTTNKLLDIVKAAVLLDGRTDAKYTDLAEIKYGLCVINDDIEEECFDVVYKRCVESLEDEKKETDTIKQMEKDLMLDSFDMTILQPMEYITRMKVLKSSLATLKSINPPTEKIRNLRDELVKKVDAIYTTGKNKFFQKEGL